MNMDIKRIFSSGDRTGDARFEEPKELLRLVKGREEPYVLVDVRTPQEYQGGHIPTAVNIPHTDIAFRPPTKDTAALVIVYCRSGGRSSAAKQTLDNLGYTRVVNFGGLSRFTGELES